MVHPWMDRTYSHAHHDDGQTGDEHADGGEGGEVANEVSHMKAPFSVMFLFCSFSVHASSNKFEYVHAPRNMVNRGPPVVDAAANPLYRALQRQFTGDDKT